jgi:hypothetical protein
MSIKSEIDPIPQPQQDIISQGKIKGWCLWKEEVLDLYPPISEAEA